MNPATRIAPSLISFAGARNPVTSANSLNSFFFMIAFCFNVRFLLLPWRGSNPHLLTTPDFTLKDNTSYKMAYANVTHIDGARCSTC